MNSVYFDDRLVGSVRTTFGRTITETDKLNSVCETTVQWLQTQLLSWKSVSGSRTPIAVMPPQLPSKVETVLQALRLRSAAPLISREPSLGISH
jgi:hypothetical protein